MTDGASSPGTQPTRARDAEAPLSADLATTPLPRGGRSAPLTLAGVLFIFVGIGGLVAALGVLLGLTPVSRLPSPLTDAMVLVGGLVSATAHIAVYLVFWQAGFPHRGRGMTVVTVGISVSYALILLITLTGTTRLALIAVAAITGILLLVFAIAAARNRLLPRGFRVVPVAQVILVMVGSIYFFVQTVLIGVGLDLTGFVFLGAGIAYVVLASNSRAALDYASAGTVGEGQSGDAPLTDAGAPAWSADGYRPAGLNIEGESAPETSGVEPARRRRRTKIAVAIFGGLMLASGLIAMGIPGGPFNPRYDRDAPVDLSAFEEVGWDRYVDLTVYDDTYEGEHFIAYGTIQGASGSCPSVAFVHNVQYIDADDYFKWRCLLPAAGDVSDPDPPDMSAFAVGTHVKMWVTVVTEKMRGDERFPVDLNSFAVHRLEEIPAQ
jgi:hypothetical protein